MARTTALNQLQEQIDAIGREAYAQGYAAAMQAIRDFASRPSGTAETAAAVRARRGRQARSMQQPQQETASAAQPSPRRAARGRPRAARSASPRPQRGTNARLIEEVLQAIAPRAARPTEIRDALKRDKGVSMAFTSIRHALSQLETRNTVEQVADSKTWRVASSSAG